MRIFSFLPRLLLVAAAAITATVTAACQGVPDDVIGACTDSVALPPGVSTDILFVIDDSGSMWEEQNKLVDQLEAFVAALLEGPVENDFQVGVVTTSVTSHAQACFPEIPPEFREYPEAMGKLQLPRDEDGTPLGGSPVLRWDDPDFRDRFRALVRQGVDGSGQEMGFEAMRLALSEPLRGTANKGFLRPGSRLLVVILSDEDDCSDPTGTALTLTPPCETIRCDGDETCPTGMYCLPADEAGNRSCQPNQCETEEGRAKLEPVERYVEFLRGLDDGTGQGRARETFLAVIGPVSDTPPHEPERCRSAEDEAYGVGVRYREAVAQMGDAAYVDSICGENYGEAMRQIAELASAPHVLTLRQSPDDGRLVVVEIRRDGTQTIRCTDGDGFTFEAPTGDHPARVTLEGRCRLRHGDRIDVRLFCAG